MSVVVASVVSEGATVSDGASDRIAGTSAAGASVADKAIGASV